MLPAVDPRNRRAAVSMKREELAYDIRAAADITKDEIVGVGYYAHSVGPETRVAPIKLQPTPHTAGPNEGGRTVELWSGLRPATENAADRYAREARQTLICRANHRRAFRDCRDLAEEVELVRALSTSSSQGEFQQPQHSLGKYGRRRCAKRDVQTLDDVLVRVVVAVQPKTRACGVLRAPARFVPRATGRRRAA